MCRRQKRRRLMMTGKDLLTELPDEILSTIVSMLTLKDAVRISVLSKRWKFIWTSHPHLCFDATSILSRKVDTGNASNCLTEVDRQTQRCKFIRRVNQLMHHRCKGTKIDSLSVHFLLDKNSAFYIDQWISHAITKGVESIDLDLSEQCSFEMDHDYSLATSRKYEFPHWILSAPGKKGTVKHMQLASCSLSAPFSSNSLSSLITVELRDVNVSDQKLEDMVSNCLLVEELNLHQCNDLIDLKIVGPNLQLKSLSIKNCFRLRTVEISAENLVTFEYTGPLCHFAFKDIPRLTGAFLNFTGESRKDGVTYSLARFAGQVPQLETLNLLSVLSMKTLMLPENPPTFSNIKQLVLTVYPFDDEDKLYWISYILKAFPRLHKLQLNLFCPSFIKQPKEVERFLPDCQHRQLTELEVNGFYGNQHEVELLKYLLDNLVELEVLVVSPSQKVYKGLNNWVEEGVGSWYKSREESVLVWLDAVVPQSVHLKMW